MGNSTAIQEMFKRVAEYFTAMFRRKRRVSSMRRRVSMMGRHLDENRCSLVPTAGACADASQVLHATCLLQLCTICAARFCVGEARKLGAARSGSGLNGAFASCCDV